MRLARFTRLVLAAASVLAFGCVPASDELPPTGAAGFVTAPSPATRGEPFTTDDGWLLRIEKVALSVWVQASGASYDYDGIYDGRRYGSGGWLFDAARPTVVYAPEISPGGVSVSAMLRGNYLFVGRENPRDRRRLVGVAPEIAARFNQPPDEGFDDSYGGLYGRYPSGDGPSILLAVRAERAGRTERMEIVLAVETYSGSTTSRGVLLNVREDDVVAGTLDIRAEELFRGGAGRLAFDEFAAADVDHDGTVTIAELRAARTTCKCPVTAPAHPSTGVPPPSLVDLIELNAGKLLAPR